MNMDSLDIAIARMDSYPIDEHENLQQFLQRHQQLSHRFDESFHGLNKDLHSLHIARFVAEHDAGVRTAHHMTSMVNRHRHEETLPRAQQNWLKVGHRIINNNTCAAMRRLVDDFDSHHKHLSCANLCAK